MRALLLAALALTWSGAAIAAPAPAPQPPALASAQIYALSPALKSVASTAHAPDTVTSQLITSDESRIGFTIASAGPVGCIQLAYAGWRGTWGAMEAVGASAFTVSAAVWVDEIDTFGSNWAMNNANAFAIPVTFGGQQSGYVPANGSVRSDLVCYNWKPGQRIYVSTVRQSATALTNLPTDYYADVSAGEGSKDGYFAYVALDPTFAQPATTSIDFTGLQGYSGGGPYLPGGTSFMVVGYSGTVTDNNGTFASTTLASTTGGASLTVSGSINLTTGEVKLTLSSAVMPSSFRISGQGLYNQTFPFTDAATYNPSGFYSWQAHPIYGPSAILGVPAQGGASKNFVVAVGGDSIDYGVGSATYRYSWFDYANNNRFGTIGFAQPGAHLSDCAAQAKTWRSRSVMGAGVDRIISNMAENDAQISSLATMQANFKACAAYLSSLLPHGYRDLYWTTMLPYVASATNNTPAAAAFGPATVASGSPSLRNAWNAWLYTQVGVTIGGVIDTASCVEANPSSQAGAGSGTLTNLNLTNEGLHPSQLGHQTIGSCAAVTNSPVWSPPS